MAAGALLMAAIMALAGVRLSFVSIMALPLVLGIGIDDGVHILRRSVAGDGMGAVLGNTGKAVVVTSLTTIAGFGSLLLCSHRGMAGLGLVLVIGIAACMLSSLTLLPALLIFFDAPRQDEADKT